MKEPCFLEAQIPDWLGHRLEGVKSLFPDMSDGIYLLSHRFGLYLYDRALREMG